MMKKFICVFLSAVLMISFLSVVPFAEDEIPSYESASDIKSGDLNEATRVYVAGRLYRVEKIPSCVSEGLLRDKDDTYYDIHLPKDENNHLNLSETMTKEPTCSSDGMVYKKCLDCGKEVVSSVLAKDPSLHKAETDEKVIIKEPTCVSDGEKAFKCVYCGQYFDNEVIPKSTSYHKAEDEWETVTQPTCSTMGRKIKKCVYCGEILKTEDIMPDSAKHVYSDEFTIDKAPNCKEYGSKSRHCIYCGQRTEVTEISPDPDAHVYSDNYTLDIQPTCQTDGLMSRHCIYCGKPAYEKVIKASPEYHVYSSEIILKNATCTETGLKVKVCSVCGQKSEETEIPKTEHTYSKYETVAISSDKKTKKVKYTCSVCGYERYEVMKYNQDPETIIKKDPEPSDNSFAPKSSDESILTVDTGKKLIFYNRITDKNDFLSLISNSSEFEFVSSFFGYYNDNSNVKTGDILSGAYDGKTYSDYDIVVIGDTNRDGKINAADARRALRYSARLDELTFDEIEACDFNRDGKATASDARSILRKSANLE